MNASCLFAIARPRPTVTVRMWQVTADTDSFQTRNSVPVTHALGSIDRYLSVRMYYFDTNFDTS